MSLDTVIAAIGNRDLADEVAQLRAESAAFFDSLPFHNGDRVALRRTIPIGKDSGWYGHREILIEGMPGEAVKFEWSRWSSRLHVLFRPDVEWTIASPWGCGESHRYLKAADRRHVFTLGLDDLREPTEA